MEKILKPKSYKISPYSVRDIHREYFQEITGYGVVTCGLASDGKLYYWNEADAEWYLLKAPYDLSLLGKS